MICTELKDNPGQSVTNAAERIAGEVCGARLLTPTYRPEGPAPP